MYTKDGITRCDYCGELIPDMMLWIELHGTYKFRGTYNPFQWHFCDFFCLKSKLEKLDWDGMEIAKHKKAKDRLRSKLTN